MKRYWIRVFENEFDSYVDWFDTYEELVEGIKNVNKLWSDRKISDFEVCDY